jgi:septal ring factor EnvC (AmiA/AmiB activator)
VVIIDHGNGYWSLYGHLAQFYSAEGSTVRGGQVIGTAGESGGRKTPGLYFELRRNEAPIDPRPWFRSAAPPAS